MDKLLPLLLPAAFLNWLYICLCAEVQPEVASKGEKRQTEEADWCFSAPAVYVQAKLRVNPEEMGFALFLSFTVYIQGTWLTLLLDATGRKTTGLVCMRASVINSLLQDLWNPEFVRDKQVDSFRHCRCQRLVNVVPSLTHMLTFNLCFNAFLQNSLTWTRLGLLRAAATTSLVRNAFDRKITDFTGRTNTGKHYFTRLSEGLVKGRDISWLCKDTKCRAVQNKWRKTHLICIGKCCGWLLGSLWKRVWCFDCVQLCDYGGTEWDGCENITHSFTANEIFIMTNLCTSIWTSVPERHG